MEICTREKWRSSHFFCLCPYFFGLKNPEPYFCAGEMAERSNAAVLKTVEVKASGGSNPSLSAKRVSKLTKPLQIVDYAGVFV
jgi:hypothetical protein